MNARLRDGGTPTFEAWVKNLATLGAGAGALAGFPYLALGATVIACATDIAQGVKRDDALIFAKVASIRAKYAAKDLHEFLEAVQQALGVQVPPKDAMAALQQQVGKDERTRVAELALELQRRVCELAGVSSDTDDLAALDRGLQTAAGLSDRYWPGQNVADRPTIVLAQRFKGRADEREQLTNAFGEKKRYIAILGMGGQGKSTLLGRWCDEQRPDLLATWPILWCQCYHTRFDAFLDRLSNYLIGPDYDAHDFAKLDLRGRVRDIRLRLVEKPVLVILDGAERWLKRWASTPDASIEGASDHDRMGEQKAVDDFLACIADPEGVSVVLFTSRAMPVALEDPRQDIATVGQMGQDNWNHLFGLSSEEGVRLLQELHVHGTDDSQLREAVEDYHGHPLALEALAGLLQAYGGDIANRPSVELYGELSPTDRAHQRLLDLLRELAQQHEDRRPLLRRIACCQVPVSVDMLVDLASVGKPEKLDGRQGVSETRVREELVELAKWRLVDFDATAGQAVMHPIYKEFFSEQFRNEDNDAWRANLLATARWFAALPLPTGQPHALVDVASRQAALKHAERATDFDTMFALLTQRTVFHSTFTEWLNRHGHLLQSTSWLTACIQAYASLDADEKRAKRHDLASALNNRGLTYHTRGDHEEALEDYDKAIELHTTLVEEEGRLDLRNDLARALNNRGNTYTVLDKYEEAFEDYDKAIELHTTLVEEESRLDLRNDLASTLNNRGIAYRVQGAHEKALEDYDKAIELRTSLVEEGHLDLRDDLAGTLNNRGLARSALGRFEDAMEDVRRAQKLWEQLVFTEGRPDLAGDLARAFAVGGIVQEEVCTPAEGGDWFAEGASMLLSFVRKGHLEFLPTLLELLTDLCRLRCAADRAAATALPLDAAAELIGKQIKTERVTPVLRWAVAGLLRQVLSDRDALRAGGWDGGPLLALGAAMGILDAPSDADD